MNKQEKQEEIRIIKRGVNSPKHDLMRLWDQLLDLGANREAKSLEVIIAKLEHWQNK